MGKLKRLNIGSVVKGRDGKPDYIKVSNDVILSKGSILTLESKASRKAGITKAMDAGKLPQDVAEKLLADVEKTPDFVRFNIVQLKEEQE